MSVNENYISSGKWENDCATKQICEKCPRKGLCPM